MKKHLPVSASLLLTSSLVVVFTTASVQTISAQSLRSAPRSVTGSKMAKSTASTTWAMSYGGNGEDRANSVAPTLDGGYIVAGYTDSFGAGPDQ